MVDSTDITQRYYPRGCKQDVSRYDMLRGYVDVEQPNIFKTNPKYPILRDLLLECRAKRVAEIGVFRGKTMEFVLRNNKLNKIIEEYHAIDPYPENMWKYCRLNLSQTPEFTYNNIVNWLRKFKWKDKVKLVRKYSSEASQDYPDGYFDLVFLDGDHSFQGIMTDIVCWEPKVRIGGILCGHDYGNPKWEVEQAVNQVYGDRARLLPETMWMVWKQ